MTSDCSVVADPTEKEEMVSEGTMTVIMNGHGKLLFSLSLFFFFYIYNISLVSFFFFLQIKI